MKWTTSQIIIFLVLTVIFQFSDAAEPSLRQYTTEQGLSQDYVYDMVQDSHGYVWVATGEGLTRFDGQEFRSFTSEDGLAENFVTTLLVAKSGELWLGHNQGSITLFDGMYTFSHFNLADSLEDKIVEIVEDFSGNIWVATQRSGIFMVDDQKSVTHFNEGLKYSIVYDIHLDKLNNVYVGTDDGLKIFEWDGKTNLTPTSEIEDLLGIRVNMIVPRKRKKSFWLGTEDKGIVLWERDGPIHFLGPEKGLRSAKVNDILEDDSGALWVGFNGKGYTRVVFNSQKDTLENHGIIDVLTNDLDGMYLEKIFRDNVGQTWFGTSGKGVFCLEPNVFQQVLPTRIKKGQNIRAFIEDSAGDFWLGTENGVYLLRSENLSPSRMSNSGKKVHFSSPLIQLDTLSGLCDQSIISMCLADDGWIWVGTQNKGICRINSKNGETDILESFERLQNWKINHLLKDRSGKIWVSTLDGIFCFASNGDFLRSYTTKDGLQHNNISSAFEDKSGRIWLATYGGFMPYIEEGKINSISLNGKINGVVKFNQFSEDLEGGIWMATDGHGLIRYHGDSTEHFLVEDGLLSDYCKSIVIDAENNIWVGHTRGLSKYNKKTHKGILYSGHSGFETGGANPSAAKIDRNGQLWFGTHDGLVHYDPTADYGQLPPNTFIFSMQVGEDRQDLNKETKLSWGRYRIKFEYEGLAIRDQDKVTYRYKLEGHDLDWSEWTKEKVAVFQNLNPGEYTFQLTACNKGGYCNEELATYTFSIGQQFWKKGWFTAGLIGFLSLLIFLMIYFRKKRNMARLAVVLSFMLLFIVFILIHTLLSPYFEDIPGVAPIFDLLLIAGLAFLILPIEKFIRNKIEVSD